MKNSLLYTWSFLTTILVLCGQVSAQINTPSGATIPFNTNTSYAYGILPTNLPTGGAYTRSQDAANAYNSWVSTYVVSCGGSPLQYRVRFDDGTSTVSEGIAYGMLLAAYAADKNLFDGLWSYYRANRNGNGLMHWKIGGCSGVTGSNAATDAEEDAAMALIVAACQWPAATTPYQYSAEANTLITAMRNCEIDTHTNPPNQISNGDGWIGCNSWGNTCRNPSYMAPAYYKEFASYVPAQSAIWNTVVGTSYTLLNANVNNTTGLVSNWCDQNGSPNSCNGPNEYGYDACRNPWRMATDVIWYNDANARTICNKLGTYIIGRSAATVGGSIPQSGGTGTHNATYVSTFAAGLVGASPASTYQTIMNQMYSETVSVTDAPPAYFGNTLRVIGLFMITGNFWKPCNSTSLPVSGILLNGKLENDAVELNWSMYPDSDVVSCELQKSENGIDFQTLEKFANKNSSDEIVHYQSHDFNVPDPVSFYRIQQIDNAGNAFESNVIQLKQSSGNIKVSPNPFESNFTVSLQGPSDKASLHIIDVTGKLVYEKKVTNEAQISLDENFPSGIYYVKITKTDNVEVLKVIKR